MTARQEMTARLARWLADSSEYNEISDVKENALSLLLDMFENEGSVIDDRDEMIAKGNDPEYVDCDIDAISEWYVAQFHAMYYLVKRFKLTA